MSKKPDQGVLANLRGHSGEDAAARHYEQQGFRILRRRFRAHGGEIDLIVAGPAIVVFVEVKARRNLETAASSVTPAQWHRIMETAQAYMDAGDHPADIAMRFDLFAVDQQGQFVTFENVTLGF